MTYMAQPYPMGFCGPHHLELPPRCCRREAKELLVKAKDLESQKPIEVIDTNLAEAARKTKGAIADKSLEINTNAAVDKQIARKSRGTDTAVIGGGCCVELSVEYMPLDPTVSDQEMTVLVEVMDSEGCVLGWKRTFSEGYHVKQGIITTYPGAQLTVIVSGAIARVRWCEVFSC